MFPPPVPLRPSPDEFVLLAREGNLIPVYTEIIADYETPISAFAKLTADGSEPAFLLESAESHDQLGRFSFVGCAPSVVFECRGRSVTITDHGQVSRFETKDDPLHDLERLMSRFRPVRTLPAEIPFTGGAVGFVGYDAVRHFETTVPEHPQDDLQLPEMIFLVTDTLLIFDHRYHRLRIVANALVEHEAEAEAAYREAELKIARLLDVLARPVSLPAINPLAPKAAADIRSNTTRERYLEMVGQAKEYVQAGDVFQVVLSQRFEAEFGRSPLDLYRCLRYINPSPYMFCLHFPGRFDFVGSSPELHVKAKNGTISIRPIAGTRRRGLTPQEDADLAAELLADPKERAEHIMLVDLARNDVGRVSEYGSVKVGDFMKVELYSHVMHIVSNVTGQMRPDCNAYDVLRSTFPAGTVSGSPKVRAMQIICGLEVSRRGFYSGAVGYFGFDGNHDSCIALRSVVLKDGKAYVQAGAGVVADSVPESEFQETINKAMAVIRAIETAAQLPAEGEKLEIRAC